MNVPKSSLSLRFLFTFKPRDEVTLPFVLRPGLTWSSSGRSQNAGMYLAHSTRTSSCCFMDSHTSVTAAIFLFRMSPLSMGAGDVIWTAGGMVGQLPLLRCVCVGVCVGEGAVPDLS